MNADLMILLNHISLNRDFLPNTWREAQPILAAHVPSGYDDHTAKAEEGLRDELARFQATWKRSFESTKLHADSPLFSERWQNGTLRKMTPYEFAIYQTITPSQAAYAYNICLDEAEEGPPRAIPCDFQPNLREVTPDVAAPESFVEIGTLGGQSSYVTGCVAEGKPVRIPFDESLYGHSRVNHVWDVALGQWRYLGPIQHNWIKSDGSPMFPPRKPWEKPSIEGLFDAINTALQ